MSERAELEWAAIATPTWLDSLRGRAGEVLGALGTVRAHSDEVRFTVSTTVDQDGTPVDVDVPATVLVDTTEIELSVGVTDDDRPMYRWRWPRSWLTAPVA